MTEVFFRHFYPKAKIYQGTLLSNDDGSNMAENEQQKQSLRTCILNFGTFLCRPPKNNTVKWPNLRFSREYEQMTVSFSFFVNLNARQPASPLLV